MKLRNKVFFILIIFLIGIGIKNNVKAVSASLSASTTNISVGNSVTITTTINAASWQVNLSGAVSDSYVGNTDDAENTTLTRQITFKPNAAGIYTINLRGNLTGSTDKRSTSVSDSIKINVSNLNSGSTTNSNSNSSSNSNISGKSSVATLANLGIRPNDFSGFRAAKMSYSTEVPNDVESVEIYATKGQGGQNVSGTGKKTLNEGANTFNIVVTAEDGKTQKTYTLTINRKAKTEEENNIATENTTSNETTNEEVNNIEENEVIDDTNEINNTINNVVENNNENKNALSLKMKNIIIIAAIAIIIIIIIIIIAVEKNKKDNEYYDLLDENNDDNENKDFDTSNMPVALQNKESNNDEDNDNNNEIDDNSAKAKDEELEPNDKDKNSKLGEMFEDVENEKLKHKPHYKGKRFK